MKSEVTVVILTYNRANYLLDEMIQSVQRQTIQNIDIIIFDNGSKDNTEEYVRHYLEEDYRIRYLKGKKNIMETIVESGVLERQKIMIDEGGKVSSNVIVEQARKQMQVVIDACKTEYILVTHDDDIMMPTMIEEELNFIKNNKDIVGVACSVTNIDYSGNVLVDNQCGFGGVKIYDRYEYCRSYATFNDFWLIILPTFMMNIKVYKKVYEISSVYNDLGLFFETNKLGAVAILDNHLYKRRMHFGQTSFSRVLVCEFIRYWDIPHLYDCCTIEEYQSAIKKADNQLAVARKQSKINNLVMNRNDERYEQEIKLAISELQKRQLIYLIEHVVWFEQTIEVICQNYKEKEINYVIWGAGSAGRKSKAIMDVLVPSAECIGYIDPYKDGYQDGLIVYSPDDYNFHQEDFILVSTSVAGAEVSNILEEKGYIYGEDYFFGYGVG